MDVAGRPGEHRVDCRMGCSCGTLLCLQHTCPTQTHTKERFDHEDRELAPFYIGKNLILLYICCKVSSKLSDKCGNVKSAVTGIFGSCKHGQWLFYHHKVSVPAGVQTSASEKSHIHLKSRHHCPNPFPLVSLLSSLSCLSPLPSPPSSLSPLIFSPLLLFFWCPGRDVSPPVLTPSLQTPVDTERSANVGPLDAQTRTNV